MPTPSPIAPAACSPASPPTSARRPTTDFFPEKADRLRAAYVPTFLNPQTGVLAGWKSADGKLHDYWFTFINGIAISYGLVDDKDANAIMTNLLRKMDQVGYKSYHLGLPGNLIPVAKADYIVGDHRWGVPEKDDGSDGFEIYENGGATSCHAYYTIKALYQLGRVKEARKLFYPMLKGFAGQIPGLRSQRCLVLDRSASMAFDLSDKEFQYPSDRANGTTFQNYFLPPSPTGSRWKSLSDAVGVFVTTLQTRQLDAQVAVVTYADAFSFGEYNSTQASKDVSLTKNYSLVTTAMTNWNKEELLGDTNIEAGLTLGRSTLKGTGSAQDRPANFDLADRWRTNQG